MMLIVAVIWPFWIKRLTSNHENRYHMGDSKTKQILSHF